MSVSVGMKIILAMVASAYVLLLSGCADMHAPSGSSHFQTQMPSKRQAELSKINFWQAAGAFSIQPANQKPVMATYDWRQTNQGYRIEIVSSLDLYRVNIHATRHSITLWKNGTLVSHAKTPENLMEKAMGWSLPLCELQDWIKGLPAPKKYGALETRYDVFGHLILLKQAGWTLYYSAYKHEEDGADLPQQILLTRSGISVKIIVREWILMMQPYKTFESTSPQI